MLVVIEMYSDGTTTTVNKFDFTERNLAEQKYHQILATAAVCTHDVHSATMLTIEGYFVKSEMYEHKEVEEEGATAK